MIAISTVVGGYFLGAGSLFIGHGFSPTFAFNGDMTGFQGTLYLSAAGTGAGNNSATYSLGDSTAIGAPGATIDLVLGTGDSYTASPGSGSVLTYPRVVSGAGTLEVESGTLDLTAIPSNSISRTCPMNRRRAYQPVVKVARPLLASSGRALRCRDLLVFRPILLRLDASIPARCRGARARGTLTTGCYAPSLGRIARWEFCSFSNRISLSAAHRLMCLVNVIPLVHAQPLG